MIAVVEFEFHFQLTLTLTFIFIDFDFHFQLALTLTCIFMFNWHASIVPGMILATRHVFLFTIAYEVENESQFQYALVSPWNRHHNIDIDPTDRQVITSDRQVIAIKMSFECSSKV